MKSLFNRWYKALYQFLKRNRVYSYSYKNGVMSVRYNSGKIEMYSGDCTVWHKLPFMTRCTTNQEAWLYGLLQNLDRKRFEIPLPVPTGVSYKGLNQIAKELHEKSKAKGFWDEKREIGTLLMLVTSELSEALEADRKGHKANMTLFDEFHNSPLPHWFEDNVKDSFEDEITDAFIRLFDLVGSINMDLEKHIYLKMKYNGTREYKHGKRY